MNKKSKKSDSVKGFEWIRERALKEAKNPSAYREGRMNFLIGEALHHHGERGAQELLREMRSK